MKTSIRTALAEARAKKTPVALATNLATGSQLLIYLDGTEGQLCLDVDMIAAATDALRRDESIDFQTGQGKVFVQVFNPPPRLIIVGAVHIAQSLAPMATMLEFDVTVVDPRGAWATTQRFPGVKVIQDWADEAFQAMGLDVSTAVVTLTHDPKLDDPALEAALKSDVFYVGALGSRRTHAKRKERLAEAGITDEQFARVHGPIGLNIGAKSPAEIAVSILGQIIEVRARRLEALAAPKVAAA